jgi:hypothetical protein
MANLGGGKKKSPISQYHKIGKEKNKKKTCQ